MANSLSQKGHQRTSDYSLGDSAKTLMYEGLPAVSGVVINTCCG